MNPVQTPTISVRGLTRLFGRQRALRGVDFDIAGGDFVALIGPNGAGKTTLLRILAGLTKPTGGKAYVVGHDVARASQAARRSVGFLSHQPLLYEDLTAEENLRFYGTMYDVPRLDSRITELLARVGLSSRRESLIRTFSRGMRQRLGIARALLHDPKVLLLDEPYTGLDQHSCEMLDQLLVSVGVGVDSRTVLLTTHSLEHGLRLSRQALLLVDGEITYRMDEGNGDVDSLWTEYCQASATGGWR